MLSPSLLELLRRYRREVRPDGQTLPGPAKHQPDLSATTAPVTHLGQEYGRGEEGVALHILRHRFATHLLETFSKTIQSELIRPVAWQTRTQAENAAARHIDGFHNPVRRQLLPGFQSPGRRRARHTGSDLNALHEIGKFKQTAATRQKKTTQSWKLLD